MSVYRFYYTHDDSDIDPDPVRAWSVGSKDLSIDKPSYNDDFRFIVPWDSLTIFLLWSMPNVLVPQPTSRWPGFPTDGSDVRWGGNLYVTLANPDVTWTILAGRIDEVGVYKEGYQNSLTYSGAITGLRPYLSIPVNEHTGVISDDRLRFWLVCFRNSNKGVLDFGIGLGDWGAYLDFTVTFPDTKARGIGTDYKLFIQDPKSTKVHADSPRAIGSTPDEMKVDTTIEGSQATGIASEEINISTSIEDKQAAGSSSGTKASGAGNVLRAQGSTNPMKATADRKTNFMATGVSGSSIVEGE